MGVHCPRLQPHLRDLHRWCRVLLGGKRFRAETPLLIPYAVSGGLVWASLASNLNNAGYFRTCGRTTSGDAYCWGSGDYGANRNGVDSKLRNAPVLVAGNQTWQSIATGDFHSCGVTGAGDFSCWGSNANGQLGTGGPTNANIAVREIPGGRVWTDLAAGTSHSCGVAQGGAAVCWGANGSGQLGDGDALTSKGTPLAVAGGVVFASVRVGTDHRCGLTPGGVACCWGNNSQGQLGDGTTSSTVYRTSPGAVFSRPTPGLLTPLSWSAIVTGDNHTCALTTAGVAYCWGNNDGHRHPVG